MRLLRLAWIELRRFRGPLPRLVPALLILVPTLYGSLYLWSNWDPYGRLDKVPVALVNEDRPVAADGRTVDAGARLAAALPEDHDFGWHVTDAHKAREGLEDGDYYFVVTVPPDFSASLATTTTAEPRQATLYMTLNDANGFIIGKMAELAKSSLQQRVSATAQSTLVQGVYGETGALKQRLAQAAEDARRLQGAIGSAPPAALRQEAAALAGGLDQAGATVPAPPPDPQANAEVLGAPVGIDVRTLNDARVYGRGLAPFFFGIALWVFGLVGFLLLRPYSPRALAGPASAVLVTLGAWVPAALLAVVGGFVLLGVVDLGLGLDPRHVWATLGVIALSAMAFVAIAQFLRAALDAVGDVVILVLLMLQLTSCGGLYPVETTPLPFRVLNPIVPMTYLVEGMRVTLTGGPGDRLALAFAVLAAYLVAALAATALVVRYRRRWNMKTLKPAVEL